MSQPEEINHLEVIQRFVRYVQQGNKWFDIQFFLDSAGTQHTDGDFSVGLEGAVIVFQPVADQMPVDDQKVCHWKFHDLTIHPLGEETDRLDIRWIVKPLFVEVIHQDAPIARKYSYTLSLELMDEENKGTYVYLDPQMIDRGGGEK